MHELDSLDELDGKVLFCCKREIERGISCDRAIGGGGRSGLNEPQPSPRRRRRAARGKVLKHKAGTNPIPVGF